MHMYPACVLPMCTYLTFACLSDLTKCEGFDPVDSSIVSTSVLYVESIDFSPSKIEMQHLRGLAGELDHITALMLSLPKHRYSHCTYIHT